MAKQTKTAAIYCRVSTGEQTTDNQLRELRAVARRSGWKVVEVYTDQGISGAKGRDQRPAFDQLCQDATRRKFDVVMAWSVDRLGRSLQHLVTFLDELHALKVNLYLHQQGVDTTTPGGKALFQMCGVFAEFERSMIVERVNSGIARAREQGTKSGKSFGLGSDNKSTRFMPSETFSVGVSITPRTTELGFIPYGRPATLTAVGVAEFSSRSNSSNFPGAIPRVIRFALSRNIIAPHGLVRCRWR